MTDDDELSEFELVRGGHAAELTVFGEIDVGTADDFEAQVLDQLPADAERLVLDVGPLGFIDSSGLQALTRIRERLLARGAGFALRNPSPVLRRMLEVTGLAGSMEVE